jgi:membrane protease YdiL (CAAX protease family)
VVSGLLFVWVFRRTGSLWSSIVLHAAMNGLTLIAVLVR